MFKKTAAYFVRGLLVLLPIALTFYLLFGVIKWIDALVDVKIPGLGVIIVLAGVTIVGILFSGYFGRLLFGLLDELLSSTPLVKIIYSSLKDLLEAFVGEKKKFNQPVLVEINTAGAQMIGFVTRKSLVELSIPDKAAVYFPYSYSLTGIVMIVPNSKITQLKVSATEAMKFAVSAGVTGFAE